jgi:hypothetical protein
MNIDSKRIDCRKCKHYYITWDVAFPYGCKAYNIKSKQMPSIIVCKSIGKECEGYQLRHMKKNNL